MKKRKRSNYCLRACDTDDVFRTTTTRTEWQHCTSRPIVSHRRLMLCASVVRRAMFKTRCGKTRMIVFFLLPLLFSHFFSITNSLPSLSSEQTHPATPCCGVRQDPGCRALDPLGRGYERSGFGLYMECCCSHTLTAIAYVCVCVLLIFMTFFQLGRTPLHDCVIASNFDSWKILIEKGANEHIVDLVGWKKKKQMRVLTFTRCLFIYLFVNLF